MSMLPPDLAGLPPELLYALSGQLTPDEFFVGGMDQQQQDPLAQYLAAYGQDYLSPALQYGEAIGVGAQKPQYIPDDLRMIEGELAERGIGAAKAQYQGQLANRDYELDVSKFGLAQQAAQRQAFESAAEYGSPTNDLDLLMMLTGTTPEEILDEVAAGGDIADSAFSTMSEALNLTDDSGALNYRTGLNINRVMGIVREAQTRASQGQQAAQQPESERWASLSQPERNKEMYMRLSQPDQEVSTNPTTGQMYTGANAAGRMNRVRAQAERNKQARTQAQTAAKPEAKKGGSPSKDWQANRYGLRTIAALHPVTGPVVRAAETASAVKKKGLQPVREAYHYLNPWD